MKENVYFGDVYKVYTKDIMPVVFRSFCKHQKKMTATAQHLSAVIMLGSLPKAHFCIYKSNGLPKLSFLLALPGIDELL